MPQSKDSYTTANRSFAVGLLAVCAACAFSLAEIARGIVQHPRLTLYGDQALMEVGARRALHLHQLLGPYSRFGFHHLGPAVFYLLAPFVGTFGGHGTGLYIGAAAINCVCLALIVLVMWRYFGVAAALWAAMVMNVLVLCLQTGTFREPWNPYLIIVPTILFVVLWSIRASGKSGTGIWAAVVGSYIVQTEIAAVPFVIVMLCVLAAQTARRGKVRVSHGRSLAAGVGVLLLMWLPVIVELWRDSPNNIQLLWRYLLHRHGHSSLSASAHDAMSAVVSMPFGARDYTSAWHRSVWQLALGAVIAIAAGLAVTRLGIKLRRPASVALVICALTAAITGTLALMATNGSLYPYMSMWLAVVPAGILLAVAPLFGPQLPSLRLPAAALVLLSALTLIVDMHGSGVSSTIGSGPWPATGDGTPETKSLTIKNTALLVQVMQGVLRPSDYAVVINVENANDWPYVAGMVAALHDRKIDTVVIPNSWNLYFGNPSTRQPSVEFNIGAAASAWQPVAGTTIAAFDDQLLSYERPRLHDAI